METEPDLDPLPALWYQAYCPKCQRIWGYGDSQTTADAAVRSHNHYPTIIIEPLGSRPGVAGGKFLGKGGLDFV